MPTPIVNRLFPAFAVINYASAYGPHRQTVPMTAWNAAGADYGSFLAWDASSVDAETMIDAFVTAEAEFFPTTVNFSSWEIYDLASPTSPPFIRRAKNIDVDGVVATPGWTKAVQITWSLKTDLGGDIKYVMLDAATGGSFDKITSASVTAEQTAFLDLVQDDANGFAGRDGGQPYFFQQITYTLSDELRKIYRMS